MPRFLGFGRLGGTLNLASHTLIAASCSGSSGATTLSATGSFSAGQRLFICQMRGTGVGSYEDNMVVSYTTGSITLLYPLENTYTDSGASQAQVVVVAEASTFTNTFTLPAWDGNTGGLFVVASSSTFSATINADGAGFRGGQALGGANSTNIYGFSGEGTAGASAQASSTSANGNGAGSSFSGGSINFGAGGAGGGNGAPGSNAQTFGGTSGQGGLEVGLAALTTLFMGGGGAGGVKTNAGTTGLAGGSGGGIVVVYAPLFTGTISSNGAAGSSSGGSTANAGGGGGAGGSVLLKCADIPSASLSAIGGNGGTTTATTQNGGAGAVGRIRIESCSGAPSSTPTASVSQGGHEYCSSGVLIY